MATENNGNERAIITAIKLVTIVVLLPLLPFAVVFNAFDVADRLSPLPGITKGGGAAAGIVTLIYVCGILGVVTTGGILVMGGEIPFVADDGPETPKPMPSTTPTEPPSAMPTASPTPTSIPTATPSAEERRQMQLDQFKAEYLGRVGSTMENRSLTGVPVVGSKYRESDGGELELWVVFWECDFPQSQDEQWLTLGNDVVNTAGSHSGAQPDRVRIYAVTNLTHFEDEITYIETADAEAVYNETLDGGTYTRNWWDRRQEPTQAENETAYRIVVEDSGQKVANTAFYVDHADGDEASCNGGARPAEGTDDRQEHQENTNDIAFVPIGSGQSG